VIFYKKIYDNILTTWLPNALNLHQVEFLKLFSSSIYWRMLD